MKFELDLKSNMATMAAIFSFSFLKMFVLLMLLLYNRISYQCKIFNIVLGLSL